MVRRSFIVFYVNVLPDVILMGFVVYDWHPLLVTLSLVYKRKKSARKIQFSL